MVRGVDVSLYSGPVSTPSWARLKSKGWSFAVVGAWGSYGCNTLARQQLAAARTAGLTTGAYVLLHFDDPEKTGEWQVRQAVESIGEELRHVRLIALDVEEKGGPVAVDPVDLIQSAVDEVARLGLPAVMYTKEKDWREMTGNSRAFAHLPLWVPRYDGVPKLGVSGKHPWRPFGGWKRQAAKQYKGTTDLHGVKVDLNISEAGLWGL
jgi:GH25 family lysozyme M1 (1,4-beta-N-acetylmuramidase)